MPNDLDFDWQIEMARFLLFGERKDLSSTENLTRMCEMARTRYPLLMSKLFTDKVDFGLLGLTMDHLEKEILDQPDGETT